MKVAIVHDWMMSMRGGEKCLEVFSELFPTATIFTLVHNKGMLTDTIEKMDIKTSFLQKFPKPEKFYRHYLPLMPKAIENFDLKDYDLVLSSSHCVAKGVKIPEGTLHICYCYTPMRYIWDMYEQYFGKERAGFFVRMGMQILRGYLQKWDVKTAGSVKHFIAISEFVKNRIKKYYNRDSIVIYPPVDTDFFTHLPTSYSLLPAPYYLIVSAFAPYKGIDTVIKAFNILGYNLKIIGTGQEEKLLKKMAKENVEFLGWLSNEELREYYRGCKAVVFPTEDDFGIVPVEAQAMGKPVIALDKGAVLETVIDGKTGIFFKEQNEKSLIDAIKRFEFLKFDSGEIRKNAERFSKNVFVKKLKDFFLELGIKI